MTNACANCGKLFETTKGTHYIWRTRAWFFPLCSKQCVVKYLLNKNEVVEVNADIDIGRKVPMDFDSLKGAINDEP